MISTETYIFIAYQQRDRLSYSYTTEIYFSGHDTIWNSLLHYPLNIMLNLYYHFAYCVRILILFFSFWFDLIWFIVFNATFSNISAISWRPVLVVGKPEYPEKTTDHGQATGKLAAASRVHPFCNLQSRARTHAVLVIGLYELLGNPTTST